jgi:AcrR family transcriptional regulator
MTRWAPGSRRRLQDAALELFTENGYSATTTAAIAERAGVTDRTFYRHFKDKSEVLFGNEDLWERALLDAVTAGSRPMAGTLRLAMHALAEEMEPRREWTVRRAVVIEANPDLAERELWKLRSWARVLSGALVARGAEEFTATAHVEVALALFRTAFQRWVHSDGSESLARLIDQAYEATGLE